MTTLLVAACAVLGVIVGSFLNVVVHRVPRGLSVVRPPSACPACEAPVRPRDNVPLLSWLLLRGRCRDCGAPISPRYPAVEAGTAAVFAATAAAVGPQWHLPALLYLGAVSVALALIDLDVHRLPDAIVLPSYAVGGALLAGASAAAGDGSQVVRAAVGLAALWVLYFALALAYPGGMGFGDVKLAGVLGMYLGWLGWPELVVGGFLAFALGGVIGGALMLTRRATRKSRIPFGPFMLLGAYGGMAFGGTTASWYLGVLGL